MLDAKFREILETEGAATFTTMGKAGPHMAATWNSYIRIIGTDELLVPAGSLYETEQNIENGSDVQMIVASKEIQGTHGYGAGFLLKGRAVFETNGTRFDQIKSDFPWARAVMVLRLQEVKQLI